MNFAMKTENGNKLVERIVRGSFNVGFTWEEQKSFIHRKLKELSFGVGFEEAKERDVLIKSIEVARSIYRKNGVEV